MSSTPTCDTQRRDGDRRLHPRRRLDRLSYIDFGSDNGGMVIDISEGGLSFQGGGPFWKHQSLRLRFLLPGLSSKLIEATGEMLWANRTGKGGGLKFVEISDEARDRVRQWISMGESAADTTRRLNIFGAAETASATRRFPGDSRTAETKIVQADSVAKDAAGTAGSTRKAGASLAAPAAVPAAPRAIPVRSEVPPRRVERAANAVSSAEARAAGASSKASEASSASPAPHVPVAPQAANTREAANAGDPNASETSADAWGDESEGWDDTPAWTSGSTSPDSTDNAEGNTLATPSDDITKRALSLIAKAQSLTPAPAAPTVSASRPSWPSQPSRLDAQTPAASRSENNAAQQDAIAPPASEPPRAAPEPSRFASALVVSSKMRASSMPVEPAGKAEGKAPAAASETAGAAPSSPTRPPPTPAAPSPAAPNLIAPPPVALSPTASAAAAKPSASGAVPAAVLPAGAPELVMPEAPGTAARAQVSPVRAGEAASEASGAASAVLPAPQRVARVGVAAPTAPDTASLNPAAPQRRTFSFACRPRELLRRARLRRTSRPRQQRNWGTRSGIRGSSRAEMQEGVRFFTRPNAIRSWPALRSSWRRRDWPFCSPR